MFLSNERINPKRTKTDGKQTNGGKPHEKAVYSLFINCLGVTPNSSEKFLEKWEALV